MRKLIEKFLNGIAWGAGATIALLSVWSIWVHFILPVQFESAGGITEVEVGELQPPREEARFHGPYGSISSEFDGRGTVLRAGEGEIRGRITADRDGIEGVRLRLALNGSAFSQWAETDETGTYAVPVPFGEYRIDGYDLDSSTASRLLAGYIGAGNSNHTVPPFTVSPDQPGEGLSFHFVRPVVKTGPVGELRLEDPIVLRWRPYPEASYYKVRLSGREHRDSNSHQGVFSWGREPSVTETHYDLEPHKTLLAEGFHYSFEVYAYDDQDRMLSRSPDPWGVSDFWIATGSGDEPYDR